MTSEYSELSPIEENEDATRVDHTRPGATDVEGTSESSEGESEGESLDKGNVEGNQDEATPLELVDEAVDIVGQSLAPEASKSRAPLMRSLLAPGAAAVELVDAYFDFREALARSDLVAQLIHNTHRDLANAQETLLP
ncbi:hypothetical protein GUJ93_ZPchr0010g10581 [Zizania palustris]|uniref:Uncharacterized protein n=1 Tax=Zizania palustris TaxID=103762 RepID=A0A8J5WCV8_ZIZPA|nr:hypothetical protein GUJ93_ZPchr0010g10581 [Zizania palustris]